MNNIRQELMELLACPKCKGEVQMEGGTIVCLNPACGLRYPIRDGIPIMLIEEAVGGSGGNGGDGCIGD